MKARKGFDPLALSYGLFDSLKLRQAANFPYQRRLRPAITYGHASFLVCKFAFLILQAFSSTCFPAGNRQEMGNGIRAALYR